MTSFGDELRDARESRAVTLDAIARETLIPRRYLEALEASRIETLPGHAFARAYIRSYVECLGLDPAPFLASFEEDTAVEPERTLPPEKTKRVRAAAPWTGVALVLVGLGVWWLGPGAPSDDPPPAERERRTVQLLPKAPEPPPATTSVAEDELGKLSIPSHGVGTNVVDRQLVGRADRFSEGVEVWFWTRVVGGEPGERIRHVWFHEGRAVMAAELRVGAAHWRTYSRLALPPGSAGSWAVEARTLDGRRLARDEFECIAAGKGPTGSSTGGSVSASPRWAR